MKKATCPTCNKTINLGERVGLKFGTAIGATIIGSSSKSLLGALIGGLLGAGVGHLIDVEVLPKCDVCQVVLRVADQVV
jgi:hypothetical protein